MEGRRTPTLMEGQPLPLTLTPSRLAPEVMQMQMQMQPQTTTTAIPSNGNGMPAAEPAVEITPTSFFVPRDYSRGLTPRFSTTLPARLNGVIPLEAFTAAVNGINSIFAEAEKQTPALFFRNFVSCLSAFILEACLPNPYNQHLKRLTAFVDKQNQEVFQPLGYRLVNPLDRGLRVLEIKLLAGSPST
eukprot:m.52415 g.52415  ORF g.52415 m.52415 type:complete len:188 (+) comp13071_c0_seq2:183-746(+)